MKSPAIETNKILARLWVEFINNNDIEGITAITDDNWRMHGGLPNLPEGSEGIRKLFASFGPVQQKWTIEDIIAEEDKVVVRAINHCKQKSFFGIPSQGRSQIFSAMFIHFIKNGRIQETWRNADDLGRVLQLGAQIKAPVQTLEKSESSLQEVDC